MPNWIEGTFRARGEKQNVINFVLKGIYPVGILGEKKEYNPTIDDEEDLQFMLSKFREHTRG